MPLARRVECRASASASVLTWRYALSGGRLVVRGDAGEIHPDQIFRREQSGLNRLQHVGDGGFDELEARGADASGIGADADGQRGGNESEQRDEHAQGTRSHEDPFALE